MYDLSSVGWEGVVKVAGEGALRSVDWAWKRGGGGGEGRLMHGKAEKCMDAYRPRRLNFGYNWGSGNGWIGYVVYLLCWSWL